MNTRNGIVWLPLLIIVATVALAGIVGYAVVSELNEDEDDNANTAVVNRTTNTNASNTNTDGVVCTMDAKQCPDGSYVGRVGPDCQFEACPDAGSGATLNGNAGANANTASVAAVTVEEAIENAARYDGQALCLSGWYQSSFEFSAMAELYRVVNDRPVIDAPYVWIEEAVSQAGLDCIMTEAGQQVCTGRIVQCGTFEYAAPGEDGFGHVGAYRYQLGA